MKKQMFSFMAGCITTALLGSMVVSGVAAGAARTITVDPDVNITVNGRKFASSGGYGSELFSFIYDGRTYVPLNALAEACGLGVAWDESTKTVQVTGNQPINSNSARPGKTGEVISLDSRGERSLVYSSSFEAAKGQVLTLNIQSDIQGKVDFFLYSPDRQERQIVIQGSDQNVSVSLTPGTWAYSCTGSFESGNVKITGILG